MKRLLLIFIMFLFVSPVCAKHVTFEDGRVCKGCTVKYNSTGYVVSVKDKQGNEWLSDSTNRMYIEPHPYLKNFFMSLNSGLDDQIENSRKQQDYWQKERYIQTIQNQKQYPTRSNCYWIGDTQYCNYY